ncbi:MAG: bifunctional YncE family protein/alkaline phosphatase family protein [Paludibacter sp.]|nr:bifunctional YncE family protein/alkaline phosphatase family protein [Paludibacter sp.]
MKQFFLLSVIFISTCLLQTNAQSITTAGQPVESLQETTNRMILPAGKLISMGDSTKENHALDCSLSPDNKWLVVEERYSIVFINTLKNEVAHTLRLDNIPELKKSMNTYSGICWMRKDNVDYVFFSCSGNNSDSYVVQVKWDGKTASLTNLINFRPLKPSTLALPNEILVRKENDRYFLYVVLNGNNQLVKKDLETGETIWTTKTGVAPYGITSANNKLYVTNWAGRIPDEKDKAVAGVPWGKARIDIETAATREGSVSIFDPVTGKLIKEVLVGLHPNKIISSPDEDYVYLTNSNSDMVSVLNSKTDKVSESISLHLEKSANSYYGDSPNGLAVSASGKILYVANGMDNALSVISLGKNASTNGATGYSTIQGFIPTAAYPSSICILNNKSVYVTNLESYGANRSFGFIANHKPVFNSHHIMASVSVIPVPDKKQLADYTKTVIACNQLGRLELSKLPARTEALPKTVPERIGEPSVFKHVLYIIKENRTYDQVLGDVKKGNGDSSLCVFGEKVTPNTHRLVDQFQLMDNFFVSGKCSAEGHSWADASIVTDYIEKNVRAWFRSYPHVLNDALAYPKTGFIWDNARKHGISCRIYGEAAVPEFNNALKWKDIYSGFIAGNPFQFKNTTTLNTVKELLSDNFPGYDGHKIPDILRAKSFIDELKQYESMNGDSLPQLMVMALPSDHTSGTRPDYPTPRAMVADNDLALGQIVEAVSQSKFWKNTAIFVVEDDSQDGWDHVSAYRTTALVISPYSKFTNAIHTAYNQPSMVRTIEQILGLPPMNIQDAIATPMVDCFNENADYTPFVSVKNQIPLDEMNPPLSALRDKPLHFARLSLEPQFDGIDSGNDLVFNQILWYSTMGNIPYPVKYSGKDED